MLGFSALSTAMTSTQWRPERVGIQFTVAGPPGVAALTVVAGVAVPSNAYRYFTTSVSGTESFGFGAKVKEP